MDEKLLADGGDKPKGHYTLTNDVENHQLGMFDKPLPYFGLGIGWFCLLVGFIFPVMWYFATILYFCNYYQRDPRERAGLAASAIAVYYGSISFPCDNPLWKQIHIKLKGTDMYICCGDCSCCNIVVAQEFKTLLHLILLQFLADGIVHNGLQLG